MPITDPTMAPSTLSLALGLFDDMTCGLWSAAAEG